MLRRPTIHAFSYPCVLSSRKDSVCRIVGLHSGKWPPALQVGSTHLAFGTAPLLKARGGTDVEAPADDIIGCTISGTQTGPNRRRSEEHTSELQSLMRSSYAVFCFKKKNNISQRPTTSQEYLTDIRGHIT